MAEIRTIADDELACWLAAMAHGFQMYGDSVAEARDRRDHLDLARCYGAFDGKDVAGTLRSLPTELTVPGPDPIVASALTMVTVMPTHRRQGLLSSMITTDLSDSYDRGEALSILIASEYPIYGRFGYGPAAFGADYEIDALRASFLRTAPGTLELVQPADATGALSEFYDRYRVGCPGAIERTAYGWARDLGIAPANYGDPWKGSCVIYRGPDGAVEGSMLYRLTSKWDHHRPNSRLDIDDLVAANPDAELALWHYACNVDWVTTVAVESHAVAVSLPWLLADARAVRQTNRADTMWTRLLHPAEALSARRYAVAGSIVIEVVDAAGYATGRYELDAGPDGTDCRPTTASPDLTMPVQTLSSVYLGGPTVNELAAVGRLDEHRPGAIDRADAMFRGAVAPFCCTFF